MILRFEDVRRQSVDTDDIRAMREIEPNMMVLQTLRRNKITLTYDDMLLYEIDRLAILEVFTDRKMKK